MGKLFVNSKKNNKNYSQIILYFFIFQILTFVGFAQSGQEIEKDSAINNTKHFYSPLSIEYYLQNEFSNNHTITGPKYYLSGFSQIESLKTEFEQYIFLIFSQKRTDLYFRNLGGYQLFDNTIKYKVGDNLKLNTGFGLAKQNTVFNPYRSFYQFSFRTSFEYSINNWLSAYIYGQYLTNPIGESTEFFDPILSLNPQFLHTEIGAGLKAKYKNMTVDFRMNRNFSPQLKPSKSFNSNESGFIIGF